MKKSLLSILLCLCLVLPILAVPAAALNDAIITFDPFATQGGSLNGASPWQYATIGQPYGPLPTPINANPNMRFQGWYSDDGDLITADTICTSNSIVVHARWLETEPVPYPFTDVTTSHWAYEAVSFCYSNGLMNGVSGTSFAPSSPCTRAMVVTVLYRMEGVPGVSGEANPFSDVHPGWYYGAVLWAASHNIVNGMNPTTFAPNRNITREQLATILYRYAAYKLYDTSDGIMLAGYEDHAQVSNFAHDAMSWAVASGLIQGISDASGRIYLKPKDEATRAQIATILMRFAKLVEPREIELKWNYLVMSTPESWYNFVTWESHDYGISFYCRPEREAGAGGLLCSVQLVPSADMSMIPVKYDVAGTIDIDGTTFNVVVMYSGGVQFADYADLYQSMMDDMPHFIVSIHGAEGYHYSHG